MIPSSGQKTLSRFDSRSSRRPRRSTSGRSPGGGSAPCRREARDTRDAGGGLRASTRRTGPARRSRGSTHCTSSLRTRGIAGTLGNGRRVALQRRAAVRAAARSPRRRNRCRRCRRTRSSPSSCAAEDERAERLCPPARAARVARDHELVAVRVDLQLEPVTRALPRPIDARRTLGDDSLEPLLPDDLEQRVAVVEVGGDADGRVARIQQRPRAFACARRTARRRAAPRPARAGRRRSRRARRRSAAAR